MPPPAPPRRPLNVRLPADLLEQVEADGGKKQAIVEDALRAWFDDSSEIADDSKENGGGSNDTQMVIAANDQQIAMKDQQIAELHVMLHDAIALQGNLLDERGKRRWWQFWRRR